MGGRWIVLLCLLAAAPGVAAAPDAGRAVPFLDLIPAYEKAGKYRVLRNRTGNEAGLTVGGKPMRGLNCPAPSRIGFLLEGVFERMEIEVGVLQRGGGRGVKVRVLGDGRVLASTPPLFVGQQPVRLDCALRNVVLLELVAEGPRGSRVVWGNGSLWGAKDRDLSLFRVAQERFSPRAYPSKFRRRVNEAIERLILSLLARQRKDGAWDQRGRANNRDGMTALVLLALLKGGVKADAPAITRGFAYLKNRPFERTYNVSIVLMALEAKYFPGGADEKDAYKKRPRLAKRVISAEDREWMQEAADWLVAQQGAGYGQSRQRKFYPVWRYPSGGYDLSNTQYALFGLAAANRCAIPTGKVWLPALRFLLTVQQKHGPKVRVSRYVRSGRYLQRRVEDAQARGFTYTMTGKAYGSMTTAGICSLILCQQALRRNAIFKSSLSKRTRTAIRDGLAWLEEYYDVNENVLRGKTWWTYYLFNLERAGVLLNQRYLGTRDWYREGAEALLPDVTRLADLDKTFALLFLKRATVPALTDPLR